MSDAVELRRKAALCRRAAHIPTAGGGRADRILLTLAAHLDREATSVEEKTRVTADFRPDGSAGHDPVTRRRRAMKSEPELR